MLLGFGGVVDGCVVAGLYDIGENSGFGVGVGISEFLNDIEGFLFLLEFEEGLGFEEEGMACDEGFLLGLDIGGF